MDVGVDKGIRKYDSWNVIVPILFREEKSTETWTGEKILRSHLYILRG